MDAAVQHSSGEALRDGWQDRPRAFGWMDASRALAAGLVAVSHLRDLLLIDYPGTLVWLPFYLITGFGPSSVIVFFVLSGSGLPKPS